MKVSPTTSPLAPKFLPTLPSIDGLSLKVGRVGTYYGERNNILMVQFSQDVPVAGVFTTSQCASAPVEWCKNILKEGVARALLVNAGNANAFSGRKGQLAVENIAQHIAQKFSIDENKLYFASTGVIGEPLDAGPVLEILDGFLNEPAGDFAQAAEAICTTDTYSKLATKSFEVNGKTYVINGIAKGSGMIAPDMATMLSFIFTDFPASQSQLDQALKNKTAPSFNSITVDSDTSTSDTVLLFGAAGVPKQPAEKEDYSQFEAALGQVMHELALQIVRDGEGATKLIKIAVKGAMSDHSASIIAKSVANSPLVKTAIAGEDANWGRIVMAIGKAGEVAKRDLISIYFGDIRVAFEGERDPSYSEEITSQYMKNDEIDILIDLQMKDGEATIYTCDLTHGYISINADYRS